MLNLKKSINKKNMLYEMLSNFINPFEVHKYFILAMIISGGLAGMLGLNEILGVSHKIIDHFPAEVSDEDSNQVLSAGSFTGKVLRIQNEDLLTSIDSHFHDDREGNNIEGVRSNDNINLIPSGTGSVVFGAIKISGTSISSDDSTTININDGLIVDGTANISGNVTLTGAVTAESTFEVTGNTTLANLTVTGTSTLTGTSTIDNLTFNDNIIGTSSNADLRLEPGGTGSVVVSNLTIDDNINITDNVIKTTVSNSNLQLSGSSSGTVEITSGLTTAAITTVGNVNVTGTETITGQLDVDFVRIKDKKLGLTTFTKK